MMLAPVTEMSPPTGSNAAARRPRLPRRAPPPRAPVTVLGRALARAGFGGGTEARRLLGRRFGEQGHAGQAYAPGSGAGRNDYRSRHRRRTSAQRGLTASNCQIRRKTAKTASPAQENQRPGPAVPRLRRTAVRASALGQVLGGEVPVEQLVDHRIDVVGTPVLVVEVVGVLPDVDRQQRLLALGERDLGVAGLDDLELAAVEDQPAPAGAELRVTRGRANSFLKLSKPPKSASIIGASLPGGLPPPPGLQAVPVERVVPDLRGVVEDRPPCRPCRPCRRRSLLERRALEIRCP